MKLYLTVDEHCFTPMLFRIKSLTTVQLNAADFHSDYREAIKIKIKKELQD